MGTNVSTFVGVLREDGQRFRVYKGETFILSHLDCYGFDVPCLMSKHFYDKFAGKRVIVTAFPKQTRKRIKGQRNFYSFLNCISVEETDSIDENRCVELEGFIKSSANVRLDYKFSSKLKFELMYSVRFNNTANFVVPCSAFDQNARALMDVRSDEPIRIKGYITGNDTHLRIVVQQFERKEVEKVG